MREAYDVVSLSIPTEDKRSIYPFPDDVECLTEWRDVFKDFGEHLLELADIILIALAISLNMERDFFLKCHRRNIGEGNNSKFRSLYYPPISGNIDCGIVVF